MIASSELAFTSGLIALLAVTKVRLVLPEMQNERDKYGELRGGDQELPDTYTGAGIPFEVVKMCVTRGITREEQRNGKSWFSPSDIEKMKLVHAMVLHAKVQSALVDCYRATKSKRVIDASWSRFPAPNNELLACARKLIELGVV